MICRFGEMESSLWMGSDSNEKMLTKISHLTNIILLPLHFVSIFFDNSMSQKQSLFKTIKKVSMDIEED